MLLPYQLDQVISLCVSLFLPAVPTSMYFHNRLVSVEGGDNPPPPTTVMQMGVLEVPEKNGNPESIKNHSGGEDGITHRNHGEFPPGILDGREFRLIDPPFIIQTLFR